MKSANVATVEARVLESLRTSHGRMDLDELIKSVVVAGDVRAVDVKIAALGLVSSGSVTLDESWKLGSAVAQ